jgi:PAS domain-containing protein
MESLVNAIPDPAVLCDMTGLVLVASQEFVNITGLKDPARTERDQFYLILYA